MKQVFRDELVVYLSFSSNNIYIAACKCLLTEGIPQWEETLSTFPGDTKRIFDGKLLHYREKFVGPFCYFKYSNIFIYIYIPSTSWGLGLPANTVSFFLYWTWSREGFVKPGVRAWILTSVVSNKNIVAPAKHGNMAYVHINGNHASPYSWTAPVLFLFRAKNDIL